MTKTIMVMLAAYMAAQTRQPFPSATEEIAPTQKATPCNSVWMVNDRN